MEVAKVTSKGQITIPISIRRKLEINEGDKVLFIYKPEGVMMVNPTTLQGGTEGVVEAAETEIAAEAIAAAKERGTAKETATPKAEAATVPAVKPEAKEAVVAEAKLAAEPVEEAAPRPVPPPVEEPPEPEKQIGGLNLGTLLDDIRSIGSNI